MDTVVVVAGALLAGGVATVAPAETATVLAAAALLLHVQPRPARRWVFVVAVGAALCGAGAAARALAVDASARTAADAALPSSARCSARARVTGSPVETHGTLRWAGALCNVECDGSAVSWAGQASLYGGPPDLARGDELDVVAQLAPPERFWNAATGDPRPRMTRSAVERSGGLVDARITKRGLGPLAWLDRLRARVRSHIEATFPEDTSPMARALVLGESDLSAPDDDAFRTSGLAHLLAVSGMHVVLVVATFVGVVRAMLARLPPVAARLDPGRPAAALGLLLCWPYAEFAGAGGSTLRACWMMTAALLAQAIGRRSSGWRAFGLSLGAMALLDPLVAFDVSFLLSAAATAGLLAFARPFGERALAALGGKSVPRLLAAAARSVATTLAATLPCAPILARFAPTLPLGGAAANLLAVPIGESVALPLCLLHACLGGWQTAERGAALVASGALWLVRAVARAFAHARWLLVDIPPPTSWQLAFAAVGISALAARRARGSTVALSVAALLIAEGVARRAGAPQGCLRATFLDVGQGDAAVVDLPSGGAVVIDGGGLVGSPVDPGLRVLGPTLRARRRHDVAVAMLSHPHPDHFTGLASGLAMLNVEAVWDTGQGESEGIGGAYAAWLASARGSGSPVMRPGALCGSRTLGGARVEVLAPCPGPSPDRGPNDNSLVVRIAFGRRAFLFVGDAEGAEEADLLALAARRPGALHADVLKVGHHGSRTSTSPAFVAAVGPSQAVISVGRRNRFGHPHAATLSTLGAARVCTWRTDRDGEVVATTDGQSLEVRAAAR